jgi:type I restriction enzyme S subunit
MQQQSKADKKEQYKETELGWLPENWEVVRFEDIGKFQYGYTETSSLKKIGPKFLRITDIDLNSSRIFWETVPYCKIIKEEFPKYALGNGDILIARIGATTGKTCIIRDAPESVFASYLIRFSCSKQKVDPMYFYLFTICESYWAQINANKEGKLKKGVSSSQLKNFKIPLPPLPEQQKIAYVLSAIQTAQVKTEIVIITLREFKQSMMKHLFRYGPVSLEETKNVKLKETEFGMVPAEWNLIKLGDVSTMIVPQRNKPRKFDGDIPWIRIEDFDGKYISGSKSNQKVSEETIQNMHLRQFPVGTVLCSCSGNMGICAITKEVLISNQTFIGIVPNNNLDPEYLYYLLSYSQKRLEALGIGVTIHYISRNKFEALEIPLSSIKVQNRISSILSQIDLKIESEENKKKSLDELFKSMLHNLITAKIRVNNMVMPNAE